VVKPRHDLAHLVKGVESGSIGVLLFGGVENYFQALGERWVKFESHVFSAIRRL